MAGSMRDKRQRPGIGREEQTREVPAEGAEPAERAEGAERAERAERVEGTGADGPRPEGRPDRVASPGQAGGAAARGAAAER
ncbi:hypothetical protein [Streptomyces sp. NPDC007369]|uniref:hypothetical protein n=1 Tax=Streptomyces sp. NPDC007369 TaxID=3154589 RepID=UPI0033D93C5F